MNVQHETVTQNHPKAKWPDAVSFREAIQARDALAVPVLQNTRLSLDKRGLPLSWSGRFAVVFRLTGNHSEFEMHWAVRCFTTPAGASHAQRAQTLSARLQTPEIAHLFVPCDYYERCLRVGTQWYPVQILPWAKGVPMGRWVEDNVNNSGALKCLATTLKDSLTRLESAGIAHGDWQHDNILVSENGAKITFVDYDGMFLPEFEGETAPELGHPNYQHPQRNTTHFGIGLDRFSQLVTQTALLALAIEPNLWKKYGSEESLLFRRNDFLAPDTSALFAEIKALAELHNSVHLAESIATLEDACSHPIEILPLPQNLPKLIDLTEKRPISFQKKQQKASITKEIPILKYKANHFEKPSIKMLFSRNFIVATVLFTLLIFFSLLGMSLCYSLNFLTYLEVIKGVKNVYFIVFLFLIALLLGFLTTLFYFYLRKYKARILKTATQEEIEKMKVLVLHRRERWENTRKKIHEADNYPDVRDFISYRMKEITIQVMQTQGYISHNMDELSRKILVMPFLIHSEKAYWQDEIKKKELELHLEHQDLRGNLHRRQAKLLNLEAEIAAFEEELLRLEQEQSNLPDTSFGTFLRLLFSR